VSRLERRWRLASGLVLALFVSQHLLGLWGGIVSFEAMEAARRLQAAIWQSPPGTVLLYGALGSHFALALKALYARGSVRMPVWEAAQLLLGLAVPLLLLGHVLGTRVTTMLYDVDTTYPHVVDIIWKDPELRVRQIALLLAVWLHAAVGLHYWLRLRRRYRRWLALWFALAVVVPALALAGFVRAGVETTRWPAHAAQRAAVAELRATLTARGAAELSRVYDVALLALLATYSAVVLARGAVLVWRRRRRVYLHHPQHQRLSLSPGQSVLDALRWHRVPHASVCGGRARCTTCRIRVGSGEAALPPPGSAEQAALTRIKAPPGVRLACQLRPLVDLHFMPLLPPDTGVARRGGVAGTERSVVAMFVDLRGSTALGEHKLPYDVVFVLNRFFAEMSEALDATRGHYAQFAGDGLLALYGLREPVERACVHALRGAVEMNRRVQRLSEHLRDELSAPLRIGVGIHAGEAIVGTMGPPSSPNLSAVGDNINVAARLESLTKDFGCALVVSSQVLELAGVDGSAFAAHEVSVRGRGGTVCVHAVQDLEDLAARLRESPLVGATDGPASASAAGSGTHPVDHHRHG
jgi:adenylate cyclase